MKIKRERQKCLYDRKGMTSDIINFSAVKKMPVYCTLMHGKVKNG